MSALNDFAAVSGGDWPTIQAARQAARDRQEIFVTAFEGIIPPDVSLVAFGSIARLEVTSGSDVDWTLLVDGSVDPRHHSLVVEVTRRFKVLDESAPGPEGVFGGLSISHDLVHLIGGEEDTNANMTVRLLLLLESTAIGKRDAYARVLRAVLHRYISEDFGWQQANARNMPRFLLNDIVRYWRTITIDFAFKRRERSLEGWALRTVKMRMSRKLTFARGLLMCFNCSADASLADEITGHPKDGPHAIAAAVSFLEKQVACTPLDAMAAAVLPYEGLYEHGKKLFGAYEQFLMLLSDETARKALKELSPDAAYSDPVFKRARDIGHDFQAGLDAIFFDETSGSPYAVQTRKWGVF